MRSRTLIAAALIFLTACGSPKVSSLSGKEAVDGPIIAVKIDDTPQAHPQIGIDKADLIYIEQVEGGLVRLAAIFSTEVPDAIGPVRSARISDIDLLAQFGKVAFFYSGAQSKFLPVLKAANLHDIGAEHESPALYTRDKNRVAPYDMILSGPQIRKRIADLDIAKASNVPWSFGKLSKDIQSSALKVQTFKVKWPASNYSGVWNGKSWDLSQEGRSEITSDGVQISPNTFIIQKVVITDSEYKDKLGGVTPFSATIGEGSGWILRNGVAIKAIWNRPNESSGTTWSDLQGNEIKLASGQIWIALTDQEPEFTSPPAKK